MQDKITFEQFLKMDYNELFARRDDLNDGQLGVAAEMFGMNMPGDKCIPLLIEYLKYPRAVVRAGALQGLEFHLNNEQVVKAITEVSLTDASEACKEFAASILESVNISKELVN